MGKYIKGVMREQLFLMPRSVDEYVEEENEVRIIDEFVNGIDMGAEGYKRAKPNYEGAPGYDPRDMLKIYIYGYLNKIRSSRKLAKECKRNIELIWLTGEIKPDFRSISDFRKDNIKSLKNTFKEFNEMCIALGLFSKELYAQDGTKIKAVNSKENNYTKAKLDKRIEMLEEKIKKYLEEIEKKDEEETEGEEERKKITIKEAKERMKKYKEYLREMEETGESQKSTTDEESKLMKANNGGFEVGYNVQAVVEGKNHFVGGYKVTNKGNDNGLMKEVSEEVKNDNAIEIMKVLADGGYVNAKDIRECLEKRIIPVLPESKKIRRIRNRNRI